MAGPMFAGQKGRRQSKPRNTGTHGEIVSRKKRKGREGSPGLRVLGKVDTNCTAPGLICSAVFLAMSWEDAEPERLALQISVMSRRPKIAPGEVN